MVQQTAVPVSTTVPSSRVTDVFSWVIGLSSREEHRAGAGDLLGDDGVEDRAGDATAEPGRSGMPAVLTYVLRPWVCQALIE